VENTDTTGSQKV